MSFSLSEYTKIDVGWGFATDPTGGAYSAFPDPLADFKGATLRHKGNGGEGRTRGGGKRETEGKGEMGKGGVMGEVWGIAPWLLGDRRP